MKMKSKYKYYLSSIIFVTLILLSFITINLMAHIIIKKNRSHYENSVTEEISTDIELKIKNYIKKIESIKRFVEERKVIGIDYNKFYLFSSGLFENDESIENISIAPNAIHEFIYPVENNSLVKYDLREDKRKKVIKAVTRAINNNEIVINGPYPMRQDKTKNIVVIRYPVYYDNKDFYGLINVVLKTSGLFQPHNSSQYRDISFQIKDRNKNILYGAKFYDPINTIKPILLDHFGWDISFGRSESYSNSIAKEDRIADILFFTIFILSSLGGIIFIITNGKAKFEKEKRTTELTIANKELEIEKELAQKYLNELILAGNIFENSITNAPVPIMIHAEDGTILNISQNWTELTHYKKSDIPTTFEWAEKAYGKNKDEVLDFIGKLYTLPETQHDGEFEVTTKDKRKLIWDFNSGYIGNLPDGRAVAMSIATDITRRIAREQQINYLSYHDQLTGLYNRRFFEEQLKNLDNPSNLPLSIVMGDVNGLKLINDAFGHYAGDKLLKTIGNVISKSIRENDISARWGGDEFIILLPNSETGAAEKLINKIQKNIKETFFEYGSLSISFGADTKNKEQENINEVFVSAEKLMYQNKLLEINSVRGETINTIMNTLFEKSIEVKEHSMRVSELSGLIAKKMGFSKTSINDIKTMGMIHDIGKIVIDLNILDKPCKLTDEERIIIEQHPLSGSRMLGVSHEYSRLSLGVLHHHERIDGKGYPNGISGDQIPIESKIISVADSFDVMTAKRPYHLNPLSLEKAIAELQKYSGTQFDKTVVDIFVNDVLRSNNL